MQTLSSAAEEQKCSSGAADGSKHKDNPPPLHNWDGEINTLQAQRRLPLSAYLHSKTLQ